MSIDLDRHLRRIPDFPKPGILFYDISTLLADGKVWRATVEAMALAVRPFAPEHLAGVESRGFLFAAPLAHELGLGFSMIRKVGKLPGQVISHSYDLEYGSDTLQVSEGVVPEGAKVVLIDDLLATGGTAAAAVTLLRKIGADVTGAAFLIELQGLGGGDKLGVKWNSVLKYKEG